MKLNCVMLFVALLALGCSDPGTTPHFVDNGETDADAGDDASLGDSGSGDVGEVDDADDGEEPGECADDPCAELVEYPDCEAATCDNVLGCSFQNVRESLPCEAEGIRDGRCQAGACVGEVCSCDEENECCDGCVPINEGGECDDGNADTGAESCQAGECVGEVCECSSGECCDGCFFLPVDTVCDDDYHDVEYFCPNDGNPRTMQTRYLYDACDGVSSECGGHMVWNDDPDSLWECSLNRCCGKESLDSSNAICLDPAYCA